MADVKDSGGGKDAKDEYDVYVMFAHEEDESPGYADQALELSRGLGLPTRTVPWGRVADVAKTVAASAPSALLLVLSRADSLVVRGPAAIRAAYNAAVSKHSRSKHAEGKRRNGKQPRGVVVAAGLPSLGWLGDVALRSAGREHLHQGVFAEGQRGVGPRRLVHADGGCLLGTAADVANLTAALHAKAAESGCPSLLPAAYKHWSDGGGEGLVPKLVLDADEFVACSTLRPEDDLVPLVDEQSGAQVVRARDALTRPCVVRAPHGGSLAAVLQALRLPFASPSIDDDEPAAAPPAAAVRCAVRWVWQAHAMEVGVAAALLLAVLVLLGMALSRCSGADSLPIAAAAPPAYYVVVRGG